MGYVTPCCGRPTLPPAVMPGRTRHCYGCGRYIDPESVLTDLQVWACAEIGATIEVPSERWRHGVEGPTVIPWRSMFGDDHGHPNHPGDYGRYLVIDLDENNRATRAEWAERNGREPRSFGYGVCRHGFGLQTIDGRSEGFTLAEADAHAIRLNAAQKIGEGRPINTEVTDRRSRSRRG